MPPLTGMPPVPRPPPLVFPLFPVPSHLPLLPSVALSRTQPPATDFSVLVSQVQSSQKGGCRGISCWPCSTGGLGQAELASQTLLQLLACPGPGRPAKPASCGQGAASGSTDQGLPGSNPWEELGWAAGGHVTGGQCVPPACHSHKDFQRLRPGDMSQ